MCNRIKYPVTKNDKSCNNNDFEYTQKGDYKPACKKFQKTDGNQFQDIPPELAEIVTVWAELPVHIKTAIKALVQTHIAAQTGGN